MSHRVSSEEKLRLLHGKSQSMLAQRRSPGEVLTVRIQILALTRLCFPRTDLRVIQAKADLAESYRENQAYEGAAEHARGALDLVAASQPPPDTHTRQPTNVTADAAPLPSSFPSFFSSSFSSSASRIYKSGQKQKKQKKPALANPHIDPSWSPKKGKSSTLFSRMKPEQVPVLDEDHNRVSCELLETLGQALGAAGQPKEAEACLKQSLQLTQQLFGEDDVACCTPLGLLADVALENGDVSRAIELHFSAWGLQEASVGMEHPSLLPTYALLALCYFERGEHAKSIENCERSLEICEKQSWFDATVETLKAHPHGVAVAVEQARQLLQLGGLYCLLSSALQAGFQKDKLPTGRVIDALERARDVFTLLEHAGFDALLRHSIHTLPALMRKMDARFFYSQKNRAQHLVASLSDRGVWVKWELTKLLIRTREWNLAAQQVRALLGVYRAQSTRGLYDFDTGKTAEKLGDVEYRAHHDKEAISMYRLSAHIFSHTLGALNENSRRVKGKLDEYKQLAAQTPAGKAKAAAKARVKQRTSMGLPSKNPGRPTSSSSSSSLLAGKPPSRIGSRASSASSKRQSVQQRGRAKREAYEQSKQRALSNVQKKKRQLEQKVKHAERSNQSLSRAFLAERDEKEHVSERKQAFDAFTQQKKEEREEMAYEDEAEEGFEDMNAYYNIPERTSVPVYSPAPIRTHSPLPDRTQQKKQKMQEEAVSSSAPAAVAAPVDSGLRVEAQELTSSEADRLLEARVSARMQALEEQLEGQRSVESNTAHVTEADADAAEAHTVKTDLLETKDFLTDSPAVDAEAQAEVGGPPPAQDMLDLEGLLEGQRSVENNTVHTQEEVEAEEGDFLSENKNAAATATATHAASDASETTAPAEDEEKQEELAADNPPWEIDNWQNPLDNGEEAADESFDF